MSGCKKKSTNWIFTYKDYPDYRVKNELMLETLWGRNLGASWTNWGRKFSGLKKNRERRENMDRFKKDYREVTKSIGTQNPLKVGDGESQEGVKTDSGWLSFSDNVGSFWERECRVRNNFREKFEDLLSSFLPYDVKLYLHGKQWYMKNCRFMESWEWNTYFIYSQAICVFCICTAYCLTNMSLHVFLCLLQLAFLEMLVLGAAGEGKDDWETTVLYFLRACSHVGKKTMNLKGHETSNSWSVTKHISQCASRVA